jgi:hypothetical protein
MLCWNSIPPLLRAFELVAVFHARASLVIAVQTWGESAVATLKVPVDDSRKIMPITHRRNEIIATWKITLTFCG